MIAATLSALFLTFSTTTHAFSASIRSRNFKTHKVILYSEANDELILSAEEIAQQMAQFRSKLPTSEADYLAAARARNEAKMQSVNNQSSDQDWQDIAEHQKKQAGYEQGVREQEGLGSSGQPGAIDEGWGQANGEGASEEQQGNDSEILLMGNEDEPQLLL